MYVRFRLCCSKYAASELLFKPSPRCASDAINVYRRGNFDKDVHLLYYNIILSYPDISNLQRQQFEMNTNLSEVEMLNLVDIFHLQTRSRLK